jgi:polyisoprenoid-binding protein YceI
MPSINELATGTYNIDPAHSTVGFVARHLMITKVRGRFTTFSGSITIAEDRLSSSVNATVDLSSVSTGDEQRDGHLKSGDFFDIEKSPAMTFASTAIKADGNDFKLVGDLTIRGVTKPVTFDLEFEGMQGDPWGGTRAGFSASTDVNRKDWGLDFNIPLDGGGFVVGDKVKIELDIQAVKAS